MTHQKESNQLNEAVQLLAENGFEGMAQAMKLLIEERGNALFDITPPLPLLLYVWMIREFILISLPRKGRLFFCPDK